MVVVLELCIWKEFIPVVLPLATEDLKVLFQLLIDVLCLSIQLRVICGRGLDFDSQQLVQFPSGFCNKLGTSASR